jgi:TrmH family RNA methyltransferase
VDGAAAPPSLALAVGNEGAGLSDAARSRLARRVAIPIASDVESLNVAVAAGILLHQLRA